MESLCRRLFCCCCGRAVATRRRQQTLAEDTMETYPSPRVNIAGFLASLKAVGLFEDITISPCTPNLWCTEGFAGSSSTSAADGFLDEPACLVFKKLHDFVPEDEDDQSSLEDGSSDDGLVRGGAGHRGGLKIKDTGVDVLAGWHRLERLISFALGPGGEGLAQYIQGIIMQDVELSREVTEFLHAVIGRGQIRLLRLQRCSISPGVLRTWRLFSLDCSLEYLSVVHCDLVDAHVAAFIGALHDSELMVSKLQGLQLLGSFSDLQLTALLTALDNTESSLALRALQLPSKFTDLALAHSLVSSRLPELVVNGKCSGRTLTKNAYPM